MNQRTALYRIFTATGELLYIGISKSFGRRWQQHARCQPWWPDVQRQTVDWFPDWTSAHAAEIEAIKAEHPRFNKMHVPLPATLPRPPKSAPARAAGALAGPSKWLSSSEVAQLTAPPTTRFTVEREIRRGNLNADRLGSRWIVEFGKAKTWAESYVPYQGLRT